MSIKSNVNNIRHIKLNKSNIKLLTLNKKTESIMTSIFENCVVDLNLLHQIGKYVVVNRSRLNYDKVVKEFNSKIKKISEYKNNVDIINNKLNYFHELDIISKIYKVKTPKYVFRKSRDFHLNYFTKNRILIFNKTNRFQYETEIKNQDLVKLWIYKIMNNNSY